MPLPASWTTVPVTWELFGHDGTPCSGRVVFSASHVVTAGGDTFVPSPIVATVTDGVMEAVSLPATDGVDITPTGWTWRVTPLVSPAGPGAFDITVPAASGTINLATVVPAVDPDEYSQYVPLAYVGAPEGVAELDDAGRVPVDQLPATLATDADLAAEAAARAAADTALAEAAALAAAAADLLAGRVTDIEGAYVTAVEVDGLVEQALEDHTPGSERDYTQRTSNYSAAAGGPIAAFSITVVGQGRPVDIEFRAKGVFHTTIGTQIDTTIVEGANIIDSAKVVTFSTTDGPPVYIKARRLLTLGVSYTFTVTVSQNTAGTWTMMGSLARPMWLSGTSR